MLANRELLKKKKKCDKLQLRCGKEERQNLETLNRFFYSFLAGGLMSIAGMLDSLGDIQFGLWFAGTAIFGTIFYYVSKQTDSPFS